MDLTFVVLGDTFDISIPATGESLVESDSLGTVRSIDVSGFAGSDYTWVPDGVGYWTIGVLDEDGEILNSIQAYVYVPLITLSWLTSTNPEYSSLTQDEFDNVERKIRLIIENYTGETFGPMPNRTVVVQGDGDGVLYSPAPVVKLDSFVSDSRDLTEDVFVNANNNNLIEGKSGGIRFGAKDIFRISGDFGYSVVPIDVVEAAKILCVNDFNGDDISALRSRGVTELQLGDFSAKLNADLWGTTGDANADDLLAKYAGIRVWAI